MLPFVRVLNNRLLALDLGANGLVFY